MTPEEQLAHERFVAEVLRIRNGERGDSPLAVWLNSNVVTAIIGVLGTALLGTWVSGVIQDRAKNNELERHAQEVRLENQNAAVAKVLDRAGAFLSASDDLLVTVNTAYSTTGRPKAEVDALDGWKKELRQKRDAADSEWRREQRSLGFTLRLLFDGDRGVGAAWTTLTHSVDRFEQCTNGWYTDHAAEGSALGPAAVCPGERGAFERAVDAFTDAVTRARTAALR